MIRELRDIEREMGRNEVAQFRGRGFDAEIVQAQQSPALALRLLRIRVCVQGKADVLRHACLHVRHGVRHRVQVVRFGILQAPSGISVMQVPTEIYQTLSSKITG